MKTASIQGDIFGGITAAVVALPLALAFGVSSGAGPIAGIYGAICVGFFAALFGGTPAQISGPTGPMTVVMAGIFTQYAASDAIHGTAIAFTVVLLGGAMQILFGLLKIGRFITLVPIPVISGFMTGIGVIIILLQIGPLLGHVPPVSPVDALHRIADITLHPVKHPTLLGLLGILIVFFMPKRWNRIFPSPLVALVLGTLTYVLFFKQSNVPVLGEIPHGLPSIQVPVIPWAILPDMLLSAAALAMLGSIDSLLTALVADNMTRTYHRSDRELMGQGLGNMVAGLLGGLPGAGATMRTVVNIQAGGRTPLSGVLHAVLLLAIVLGAAGFASDIPHAILAAILIKVGIDIIDWDYLSHMRYAPKAGVVMMSTVLLITVFVDLITAVGVGMVIASFVFMKRMADLQLRSARMVNGEDQVAGLSDEENQILKAAQGKIVLYQLSGPLSFPAAKDMVKRMSAAGEHQLLVLDFTQVNGIDFTSCRAISDIIRNEQEDHRTVLLCGASASIMQILEKQKALRFLSGQFVLSDRINALHYAQQWIKENSADEK